MHNLYNDTDTSNTPSNIILKLKDTGNLTDEEWKVVLTNWENEPDPSFLYACGDGVCSRYYGDSVYIRGLIEFTNFCKNDCLYCGIRRDNRHLSRYRLTKEQIIDCAKTGYELGFRTFVLQGGEDMHYTRQDVADIVYSLKSNHPDCAVTLSIGERSREDYKVWYDAGADRYLLRHETADKTHYARLHPESMSFDNRMRCLYELKSIGYQTGCGFMVGSPYQTIDHLVREMRFLKEFQPDMVGIGPFIPHHETPFKNERQGTLELTLKLISLIRLLLPKALIPATTALGTIHPQGREMGLKAGANVVMPNLSPRQVREDYSLYDNKICTGEEAAECIGCLTRRVEAAGKHIIIDRGDRLI